MSLSSVFQPLGESGGLSAFQSGKEHRNALGIQRQNRSTLQDQ